MRERVPGSVLTCWNRSWAESGPSRASRSLGWHLADPLPLEMSGTGEGKLFVLVVGPKQIS